MDGKRHRNIMLISCHSFVIISWTATVCHNEIKSVMSNPALNIILSIVGVIILQLFLKAASQRPCALPATVLFCETLTKYLLKIGFVAILCQLLQNYENIFFIIFFYKFVCLPATNPTMQACGDHCNCC